MRSVLALSTVLLLAACGTSSPQPSAPSAPVPSTADAVPSQAPPTLSPKTPTDNLTQTALTGTVRITDGCINLVTKTTTWTLLGAPAKSLKSGTIAEVVGLPAPQAETSCVGAPFNVQETHPR
jgi:hypothetical protein